jgi:ABC-2 type transport system ATP-binding protein
MASDIYLTVSIDAKYDTKSIVQCQDLTFPVGSVVGILGRNGAGKTTLLKCIAGLFPIQGIAWSGSHKIASLIETPRFRLNWTGRQHLDHQRALHNTRRSLLGEVINTVGLSLFIDDKIATYSLGQKQRLGIARALVGDPDCILLDEPTNGLDPQGIVDIRDLIARLHNEGKNIIISSHLLGEIQECCTHLVVLHEHQIQFSGPIKHYFQTGVLIQSTNPTQLETWLKDQQWNYKLHSKGFLLQEQYSTDKINELCFSNNIVLNHLEQYEGSIEEYFVEETGNE